MSSKRAFKIKWKAFFIIFRGLSVAKNCLKPESAPFRKIYRKTLLPEPLFNKVAGFQPATLLKKRLRHWHFSVKFEKFLRKPPEISAILLLPYKAFIPKKKLCMKLYVVPCVVIYRIFSNRSRGFYMFFALFSAVSIRGRPLFTVILCW